MYWVYSYTYKYIYKLYMYWVYNYVQESSPPLSKTASPGQSLDILDHIQECQVSIIIKSSILFFPFLFLIFTIYYDKFLRILEG